MGGQAKVQIGDRIKDPVTGRTGVVVGFGKNGDPQIKFDDDGSVAEISQDKLETYDPTKEKVAVGDKVKDKNGKIGVVTRVDSKGNPVIRYEDGTEATIAAADATVTQKAKVHVGDHIKDSVTGRTGVVVGYDANGNPQIKYDDDGSIASLSQDKFDKYDPTQEKITVGDKIKDKDGKIGVVTRVDSKGNPVIRYADGSEKTIDAAEATVTQKAKVHVGDHVKDHLTGRTGVVIGFDEKGDPQIKFDDD